MRRLELEHLARALEIAEYEVHTSLAHLKMHGCVEELRGGPAYKATPYGKALLHALYE